MKKQKLYISVFSETQKRSQTIEFPPEQQSGGGGVHVHTEMMERQLQIPPDPCHFSTAPRLHGTYTPHTHFPPSLMSQQPSRYSCLLPSTD